MIHVNNCSRYFLRNVFFLRGLEFSPFDAKTKYCLYYLHVHVLHIVYVRSFFFKKSSQKAHLKLISNIPLIKTADLHVFKEIKGLKGGRQTSRHTQL